MYVLRGRRIGRIGLAILGLATAACKGGGGGGDGFNGVGDIAVSGRITYDSVPAVYDVATGEGTLAFDDVTEKPVRNAVVQLRQRGNVLLTTTTDEDGDYAITYTSTTRGEVEVAVLARTTSPAIQVEDNTDGNAVWGMSHPLEEPTGTVNLHATHGWNGTRYVEDARVAAPFAVLDALSTAAEAFLAVRAVSFPELKVNWSPDNVPQNGNVAAGQIGTSHYDPTVGEIFVLGKDGVDTDEFDTHVIVHEWTHYFEDQLARSDSPGGPHGAGDVLDPRLAFGEGLGNAVAAMTLPESLYVDTLWDGTTETWGAFGFDAETAPTPTDDTTPGGFSESTVLRVLYDVYDVGANEPHDTVDLGLGPIYDVLVGPQRTTSALTTIASFIAGLKAQAGVNATAVNTLIAEYDIGPVTSEWGEGDTGLASIYTRDVALPYNATVNLTGGVDANKRSQNQYITFVATGAGLTVSATHATEDVGITLYRQGEVVGSADELLVGTESFDVASTASGATYVLVVTGFSEVASPYAVTVSIESN